MSSHTNDESSADEASSSFGGDSTYDFLDDRSVAATDDESQDGLAESTASVVEQDHALPRTDDETPNRDFKQSAVLSPTSQCYDEYPLPGTKTEKCLDHHNDTLNRDLEPIRFDESGSASTTCSTSREYSHPFHPKSLCGTAFPVEPLIVRQTMGTRALYTGRDSYRVFYIGDDESKDVIIHKIATVLAVSPRLSMLSSASTRASKFNIVPISSFGEDDNPEVVLIDSSGVSLEVEEMRHASSLSKSLQSDILQITLTNGSTIRSVAEGSNFKLLDTWELPDLAVINVPHDDDVNSGCERFLARRFLSRHGIPVLTITATPDITSSFEISSTSYFLPHLSLQNSPVDALDPRQPTRIPIDLHSFLRIDAGQLNRSFACLSQMNDVQLKQCPTRSLYHNEGASQKENHNDFTAGKPHLWQLSRRFRRTGSFTSVWSFLLLVMGSAIVAALTGSILATFTGKSTSDQIFSASAKNVPASSTANPAMTSAKPTSSVVSITNHITGSDTQYSESVSTDTDLAAFILESSAPTPNKSEQFKVQILGDRHIVLMPPRWLKKSRKTPQLSFSVSREGSTIRYEMSHMFEDVYALRIPHEEAHGPLHVRVWTRARPSLDQSFEIDFGSSWLRAGAWKRATQTIVNSIQDDLIQIQTNLHAGIDRVMTKSLLSLPNTRQKLLLWRRLERSIMQKLPHNLNAIRLIPIKASDLARCFSYPSYQREVANMKQWLPLASLKRNKAMEKAIAKVDSLLQNFKTRHGHVLHFGSHLLSGRVWRQNPTYFHEAQKIALKFWWKMEGLVGSKKLGPRI